MKKLLLFLLVIVSFSSCLRVSYPRNSSKGYGCKGKESWKHMEKRINKPY
jgi:hypothetical protein